MLLAMKIKAAITAAALASPIALTITPAAHPVDSVIIEIAAKPVQYPLGSRNVSGIPIPFCEI